jgi:TonB family protein
MILAQPSQRGWIMSDTWREWEGQVIDGAFQLRRHLGGSDHSVVFLTERGESKQKAAIKFVQAGAAGAEAQLSRWKQIAQLSHPNLIRLYETGRCQLAGMNLLYVVMEYADENLAQFLPHRPLAPAETRDMLEPFLDTLKYLHSQNFVHGRIQPGNILAIDDQLKLSSDTICRAGDPRAKVEKPDAYSPPDAATRTLLPPDDVWSLGITLVEALTQHAPTAEELASPSSQQDEPQLSADLPEPFLDIARHSLRRDSQRRWSVAEIAARLNPQAAPPPLPVQAPAAIERPASLVSAPAEAAQATATAVAVATATPTASAANPSLVVDPLSVPLSPVTPLHMQRKHALQNQAVVKSLPRDSFVPGKALPGKSYYIFFGVLIALSLGVMLAIPRWRSRGTSPEPASSATPHQPAAQPQTQPAAPVKAAPAGPSKPQSKSQPKSAPASNDFPQRSAVQPAEKPEQSSAANGGEKQLVARNESSADASSTPAALRSAVPRSDAAPVVPAIINRDAVTAGEVLTQVLPDVSQKSRNTIHGTVRVVVKVLVNASGDVSSAEVASASSHFFADAALKSARRWDFAPAKVDGAAVPSEWLLHFDFTQTDTKVTPLPTKP